MSKYLELFQNHSISYKGPNNRGYVRIVCPFCSSSSGFCFLVHDDPQKNLKAGFSNCHSCGTKNSVEALANLVGMSVSSARQFVYGDSNADDSFRISFKQVTDEKISRKETLQEYLSRFPIVSLPENSVPINENLHKEAYQYLIKRGLTPEDIVTANIHVMPLSKEEVLQKLYPLKLSREEFRERFGKIMRHSGRVIFPVTVNGKNYGFVSRDYTGKAEVKVLNSEGALTSSFFYNFDQAKKSRVLVICEGIFDAIKCGIHQSIALLGKATNEKSDRVELIKRLNPEVVVIYLDNGAYSEAQELASFLAKRFSDVRIITTRPFISGIEVSEKTTKILSKVTPIEIDDNHYVIMPNDLWIAKEFAKLTKKSLEEKIPIMKLAFNRIKLPRYNEIKDGKSTLIELCRKFDTLVDIHKKAFSEQIQFITKLGHLDAGDRTREENQTLIDNSSPYCPFFDLNLIG